MKENSTDISTDMAVEREGCGVRGNQREERREREGQSRKKEGYRYENNRAVLYMQKNLVTNESCVNESLQMT